MACGGCNPVAPVTKDQVENLIQKAIDSGKVQGGLKTCAGEKLPAESKVLMCSELTDAVNAAIEKGDIKVIKDVVYKENKIVVTDGAGKDHEYGLPYPKMAIGDKEVVLTNPNGEHVAVPKSSEVLTADDFDKTIVKGANEAGKLGVKVKPKGGLEATEDGVGIKAGDGLKVGEDGSLQVGEIFANKPILGKGTKAEPLKLALSDKDFVVNPVTGAVSLKPVNVTEITNLNTGYPQLGYSVYYGIVNQEYKRYVVGVPPDIASTSESQPFTTSLSEVKANESYDFNGWQIASSVQVDQYLVGAGEVVWHRTNDSGMNPDGTLKNPNDWSQWRRETNVNVSVVQLNALQKQVTDLTGRVETLENEASARDKALAKAVERIAALEDMLSKFNPLKDAAGKVLLGSIKP